ncbi:hypothetical protein YN1_7920 [Nanoarchaeota archaeon]
MINSDKKFIGSELEDLVSEIFLKEGFSVERNEIIIGKSGERNEFDILAHKKDIIYIIECKNWENKVSKKEIESFIKKLNNVQKNLINIL